MTQPEITGQLILDLFKIVVRCLNRPAVLCTRPGGEPPSYLRPPRTAPKATDHIHHSPLRGTPVTSGLSGTCPHPVSLKANVPPQVFPNIAIPENCNIWQFSVMEIFRQAQTEEQLWAVICVYLGNIRHCMLPHRCSTLGNPHWMRGRKLEH